MCSVIPAKAGTYDRHCHNDCGCLSWVPTAVGMTNTSEAVLSKQKAPREQGLSH